jgi:hypothetical protein
VTRAQLEHVIRAAAGNADTREIVVIGSQAILGPYPDAPAELLISIEADVFPKECPADSILIDGAIGERSLFHERFGYYAHGVDDTTAVLPEGWRDRLVRIENENTRGAIGWCLEPNDLAISKLAAGREKDISFVTALLRHSLVAEDLLRQRIAITPVRDTTERTLLLGRLARCETSAKNR